MESEGSTLQVALDAEPLRRKAIEKTLKQYPRSPFGDNTALIDRNNPEVSLDQFVRTHRSFKNNRDKRLRNYGRLWIYLIAALFVIPAVSAAMAALLSLLGIGGFDFWFGQDDPEQFPWFLLPGILALYWTIGLIVYSGYKSISDTNHMLKFVLLRPFNEQEVGGLKSTIRRQISTLGYCFTLADKNFKPSISQRLLIAIDVIVSNISGSVFSVFTAPFIRAFGTSFRIVTVNGLNRLKLLHRRLAKQRRFTGYNLSVLWVTSNGASFNIRANDKWWKTTVSALFDQCDAVIMDISDLRAASVWELELLARRDQLDHTVLIANQSEQADDDVLLANKLTSRELQVFRYDQAGNILDEAGFESALLEASYKSLMHLRSNSSEV